MHTRHKTPETVPFVMLKGVRSTSGGLGGFTGLEPRDCRSGSKFTGGARAGGSRTHPLSRFTVAYSKSRNKWEIDAKDFIVLFMKQILQFDKAQFKTACAY